MRDAFVHAEPQTTLWCKVHARPVSGAVTLPQKYTNNKGTPLADFVRLPTDDEAELGNAVIRRCKRGMQRVEFREPALSKESSLGSKKKEKKEKNCEKPLNSSACGRVLGSGHRLDRLCAFPQVRAGKTKTLFLHICQKAVHFLSLLTPAA